MLPSFGGLGPALPFLYAGIILVATWLLARAVSGLLRSAMSQGTPQVAANASRMAGALIWVVGSVVAVQEIGVSTDILLLVVGLGGVAALVAFRSALENLGAKYFSDVYVPYKLGDSIRVGSYAGKVIEINPMTTVVLSEADELVAIPNQAFLKECVVNATPQAWREVVIPITLGSGLDLPAFESDLRRSMAKLRPRLDPRFPPLISTRSRGKLSTDLALTLLIRQPQDRDMVTSEANRRIFEVLEKHRRSTREGPRGG